MGRGKKRIRQLETEVEIPKTAASLLGDRGGHQGRVVGELIPLRIASLAGENGSMNEESDQELDALIRAIPEGWTRVQIAGQGWGITRTTRAGGKAISFDAERLGDKEQLGANVWTTSEGLVLRPCEMPEEKVMQFLRNAAATFNAYGTRAAV
jgi:hypothetical protein